MRPAEQVACHSPPASTEGPASHHATRLPVEKLTSPMSGEPRLRRLVLAARGHTLPLYHAVMQEPPALPELVAESLRRRTEAPR
ncbi:MAG: hypothetical protein HY329_00645 [Chloroflexi bacterium]|nr:hypothetical protein [Chloroflexota bacterium]